jgi:hypothetical protein
MMGRMAAARRLIEGTRGAGSFDSYHDHGKLHEFRAAPEALAAVVAKTLS